MCWQSAGDPRSGAGRALDSKLPCGGFRAFAAGSESDMALEQGLVLLLGSEPPAIVGDFENDVAVLPGEAERHPPRLGVLAHVCE